MIYERIVLSSLEIWHSKGCNMHRKRKNNTNKDIFFAFIEHKVNQMTKNIVKQWDLSISKRKVISSGASSHPKQ